MNVKYKIKLDFLHAVTKTVYTSLERALTDELPDEEIKSLRQEYSKKLINLLMSHGASYTVLQNDEHMLHIRCSAVKECVHRLECTVELMHGVVKLVPYTDAEIIYIKPDEQNDPEEIVLDTITKRVNMQDNRYVHVFRNISLKDTHVLLVYTNIVAPIDIDVLGGYRTKSYLIQGSEHNPSNKIQLSTSVTEYYIGETLSELGIKSIYKWVSEWLDKLRSLTEIKSMTQGLDESDSDDLNMDLLLLPDTLYRFDKDNEHDIRVLEHSVVHYKRPYILFSDKSNRQAYCCIVTNYIVDNLADLEKTFFTSSGIVVEKIYTTDIEGNQYQGIGWSYLEDKPLKQDTLNNLLSLMKYGEVL